MMHCTEQRALISMNFVAVIDGYRSKQYSFHNFLLILKKEIVEIYEDGMRIRDLTAAYRIPRNMLTVPRVISF